MLQREIEFRGKRAGEEHWIYGYLREVFGRTKRVFMISPSRKFEADGLTDTEEDYVEADTIGQFTGKYDKNKRKVYEGDIVLQQGYNGRKEKMVVRFENGAFIVGYHSGSSTRKKPMLISDKCEVIGNIHDNPELLQEG